MNVSRRAVTVRAFEPEDEAGVLALLQEVFGRWPTQIGSMAPAEFFRWKHTSSPFGASVMYVGELDGQLAGFTAYMPWLFTDGSNLVRTLRGVDFAVAPAFRRHGVNLAIRRTAKSLTGAAFIWGNPNEPVLRGGLKVGSSPSERIPYFARLGGRPLRAAWRAATSAARTPAHLPVRAESAGAVLVDGDHVNFVLGRISQRKGCLETARSLSYLRWRYGSLAEYHAVRTSGRDHQEGIAIFRLRRHGSVWVTDICELLLAHDRRATARQLLRMIRDSAGSDLLTCGFQSRRKAALLGFVQASRGARLITQRLDQPLALDVTSSRSWALSRGDLELL
jgi:hypothetical protein